MPFKFLAEIQTPDGKALWARSIYHLSTISDTIKFTIRQTTPTTEELAASDLKLESYTEVSLTAVNMSKTSMLNCSFRVEFFALIQIDGELPFGPVDGDLNQARVFSFLVNSKNLNTLFNVCGLNAEKFKLLVIGSDREEDELASLFNNKIFVECETKSGMTKNYKLNFVRSRESFDLRIRSEIRDLLNYQEMNPDTTTSRERINYLCIDPKILRNFLNMFPSNLEDFRIELSPYDQKVLFYGYNRQESVSGNVGKRDAVPILSPSMSLSIELSLLSLDYSNVQVPTPSTTTTTTANDEDDRQKTKVSYRLRDFKSFVNLVSQFHYRFGSSSETNRQQVERNRNKSYSNPDAYNNGFDSLPKEVSAGSHQVTPFHILFNSDGPFAMFERTYEDVENHETLRYCQMSLILMIDQEVDKVVMNNNSKLPVSVARSSANVAPASKSTSAAAVAEPVQYREPLFVQEENEDAPTDHNEGEEDADMNDYNDHDNAHENGAEDTDGTTREDNSNNNDIFWDNARFHQTEITKTKDKNSSRSNKNDNNEEEEEEEEDNDTGPKMFINLGPTQNITRVKGIFD